MQFHIPTKYEERIPIKLTLDEEVILVEHARPYAYLQTGSRRLLSEETMHEHWKKAVRSAPSGTLFKADCLLQVILIFVSSLSALALLHQDLRLGLMPSQRMICLTCEGQK